MPDSTATTDRSIPELLRDLTNQYSQLMRDEFALMKAEMGQKVNQVSNGAVMLGVGAVLGLAALIFLLLAVTLALTNVVAPWLSALIVGGATLLVALIVINKGKSNLKTANLQPKRSMASVREDAQFTKEHAK
ncbi:phage holin family protein [Caenispirillum salinarum]|uniref:phage holin family protein n=1 Tax=Caenispirillum salinarum TaxID=859058 RepID=UPI00384C3DDC